MFVAGTMVLHNPWDVPNASEFLKYCCPECPDQYKDLPTFTSHATENHELSKILFEKKEFFTENHHEIKSEPNAIENDDKDDLDEIDLLLPKEDPKDEDFIYDVKDEDDYVDQDDFENNFDEDEDYDDELEYKPLAKKKRKSKPRRKSAKSIKVEYDDEDFSKPSSNRKKKRQKDIAKPDVDGWTKCEYCPEKNFLFVFELLEHLTSSHGGERYVTFPLTSQEIVGKDARLAENNWQCRICENGEMFSFKSQLISHWHEHHAKENYTYDACQWCLEIFDTTESVLKHHEKVHPNLPKREYPCSVSECYHHGGEMSLLAKHYKRHEVPFTLPLKCNICDLPFIIEESLLYHLKTVHSQEMQHFQCSECPSIFLSDAARLIHISMHGSRDDISSKHLCRYCLYYTDSKMDLVNHSRENHEFETLPFFHCEKCDFVSEKFPVTEEHCKVEHGMKYAPFSCKHCDHVVNELGSFRRHVITHRDVRNICDECGKVLKSKTYLKKHIDFHHKKQDRCVCDICGFSTSHQVWLKRHILNQHQKVKTKVCPHCMKGFRDKNCLEVHLDHNHPDIHEKKFFCQECGAGFMFQYSLTRHLYKHKLQLKRSQIRSEGGNISKPKDLGPVKCPQCDKSFNGQENLSRHITLSHKKINCQHCQKSVLNKFQLKKHLFFDHGETEGAFLCSLCPEMVFFSKVTYSKHMQKAHSL